MLRRPPSLRDTGARVQANVFARLKSARFRDRREHITIVFKKWKLQMLSARFHSQEFDKFQQASNFTSLTRIRQKQFFIGTILAGQAESSRLAGAEKHG